MTKTGFLIATTAMGLILGATTAHTAGYAIKETSATQLGQAFAGSAALKGDVSAMWNNPATMTSLSGHHAAAAATLILPSAKFKDAGSTATGTNGGNGGKNAVVPAGYLMMSVSDNTKVGLAITSPFGLETKYDDGWKGRFLALKSKLRSMNINPNVAYKVNDRVSLGMGVAFQYMDVELTRKINNVLAGGAGEGNFKATGKDWGAGFNVGAVFVPWENGRFGVAYRSQISHGLTGTTENSNVAAGFAVFNVLNGKTDITADVTTPASLDFSYAHDIGEAWTVLASAVWTQWSKFNELTINRASNGGVVGATERQAWKNVWFFALGANWKFTKDWMARIGVAYDQEPIQSQFRTPKLPGNDRTWASVGLDWSMTDWAKLSLNYTHLFIKDGKVDAFGRTAAGAVDAASRITGKFNNKVDIIGLQANFKF